MQVLVFKVKLKNLRREGGKGAVYILLRPTEG